MAVVIKQGFLSISQRSKPYSAASLLNQSASSMKSWERSAKLVKNSNHKGSYLEQIRETHDPSMQLKTLEDELKQTMGKALGKQGEKLSAILSLMNHERKLLSQIMSKFTLKELPIKEEDVILMDEDSKKDLYNIIERHNKYFKDAEHARWELIVHRQAIGFITQNHRYVQETFPIPDIIVPPQSLHSVTTSTTQKPKLETKESVVRNFGDQLDWWEKIGRWR